MLQILHRQLPARLTAVEAQRLQHSLQSHFPSLLAGIRLEYLRRLGLEDEPSRVFGMQENSRLLGGEVFPLESGTVAYLKISKEDGSIDAGVVSNQTQVDSSRFFSVVQKATQEVTGRNADWSNNGDQTHGEPEDARPVSLEVSEKELEAAGEFLNPASKELLHQLYTHDSLPLSKVKLGNNFASVLQHLEDLDLVRKDYALLSKETGQQILKVASRESLETSTFFSAENVDEVLSATPFCRSLIENDQWLLVLVLGQLRQLGFGGDQARIHVVQQELVPTQVFVRIHQQRFLLVLTHQKLTIDESYLVSAQIAACQLEDVVLVSTQRVSNLMRSHLKSTNPGIHFHFIDGISQLPDRLNEVFTEKQRNCLVEEGASLERAVLWGNTYVGRKSRAFGAVLCRNVTLQSHASVAEGVVVGDNVFVGRGANLQPDVKVWPDKNVEPGAAVSMSLIWGRKWPGSLFSDDGICGLGNIEITPEYALKLGAAYGAVLPKGAVVVASRDSHPATRMINRALICGLVSVGVSVRDLQAVPTPVGRNALRNAADCYGGIHVRVSSKDSRQLQLEFLDASGVSIDRSWERKIENRFFREDFRRTPMDEVGMIEFPIRILEQYQEAFRAQLDVEAIRKQQFKVVIDYGHGHASTVLPPILGRLGIEAVSLNAYIDSLRVGRSGGGGQVLEQLSSIVTTLRTELGVAIDSTGERLMVVDEKGGLWQGAKLLVLFATLVMQSHPGAMIAVPVNAPSMLVDLGKKHGAKVILARTDSRSLTYTALLGDTRFHLAATSLGEFAFPSFSSGFDGMFAFAKLLEMLSAMQKPLSEYESEIPEIHLRHYQVECEIAAKGRVMRALLEKLADKPVEVIDGVKVREIGGWVLIIPHRSLPEMQMWVEADSDERLGELADQYRGLIRTLAQDAPVVAPNAPREQAANLPTMVSEDRAFHFWTSGRYLGVKARTLREFVDTLHYVDGDSLVYHLERNDFANWLELELGQAAMSSQVRQLRSHKLRGEGLRSALLALFSVENEERLLNQGATH